MLNVKMYDNDNFRNELDKWMDPGTTKVIIRKYIERLTYN